MDNPQQEIIVEPSQPRRASFLVKTVLGIVIFIGLAWGLSALREKPPQQFVENELSETAISSANSYSLFQPIAAGGEKYTLEGVDWSFEDQGATEQGLPITKVRLQLIGLKRGSVAIDVAKYRLGTYRGSCASVDPVVYSSSTADRGALAFAECRFGGVGRQLGVFQGGNFLLVKARADEKEGGMNDQMTKILTIDVPNIVER